MNEDENRDRSLAPASRSLSAKSALVQRGIALAEAVVNANRADARTHLERARTRLQQLLLIWESNPWQDDTEPLTEWLYACGEGLLAAAVQLGSDWIRCFPAQNWGIDLATRLLKERKLKTDISGDFIRIHGLMFSEFGPYANSGPRATGAANTRLTPREELKLLWWELEEQEERVVNLETFLDEVAGLIDQSKSTIYSDYALQRGREPITLEELAAAASHPTVAETLETLRETADSKTRPGED